MNGNGRKGKLEAWRWRWVEGQKSLKGYRKRHAMYAEGTAGPVRKK